MKEDKFVENSNKDIDSEGIEILCIGTELLLGNILNANAKWIAEELASLGLPHYRQTVIGDNFKRLKNNILEASKRSKILITTGGLGPTPDDITTETIASAFGSKLEKNDSIWKDIQEKLICKTPTPSLNNQKQAFFPVGAKIIPNKSGTAPGMIWTPIPDFTILTFPGVPNEMKDMWSKTAVPWLKENGGIKTSLISKTLRFSGITESNLSEQLEDLMENENPTVAPYASLGEVKIRITAQSKTSLDAQNLILPIETEILRRTGTKCFGSGEDNLASVLIKLLRERGETLAIAESCTGGNLGAALTAIPGSSDVFLGGVIAYQNSIKKELLDIPQQLIDNHGAVSREVAEAMAKGVLKKFNSDWSLSTTGIAGPSGGSHSKPIGLVEFCIQGSLENKLWSQRFNASAGRTSIQKLSVLKALNEFRLFLLNKS